MILSHFSNKKLKFDPNQQYDFGRRDWFKPVGLWLSDETSHGWKSWCEDREFGLERLKKETRFKVDLTNVILVDTIEKLSSFTKEFSYTPKWADGLEIVKYINWPEVKKLYSGIIITPYQWECRLDPDLFWYYSWDCASGCIWDLTKLKIIKK